MSAESDAVIASGSSDIVNGSGTVTVSGLEVGASVMARVTVVSNGITYSGTSSATTIGEGTTNISVTVSVDGTNVTIPSDADQDFIDSLFEKFTPGSTYSVNIGSLTNLTMNSILSKIDSKSDCNFNIVVGSGCSETAFSPGLILNGATNIKKVDLSASGIAEIGVYAFKNCTGLTEVTLPSNGVVIDDYAFQACSSLSSINLGNVTSIGMNGFHGCSSLTSVDLTNVTSLGERAFLSSGLTSVSIPSAVSKIPGQCFQLCEALETVEIAAGSTLDFDEYCFGSCTKLYSIAVSSTSNITIGNDSSSMAFSGMKDKTISFDCSGYTKSLSINGAFFYNDPANYVQLGCINLNNGITSSITLSGFYSSHIGTYGYSGVTYICLSGVKFNGGYPGSSLPKDLSIANSSGDATNRFIVANTTCHNYADGSGWQY